jgi:hypothetical protein
MKQQPHPEEHREAMRLEGWGAPQVRIARYHPP